MVSNEQQHNIQELQIRFQAALEQSLGEGASVLAQAHPADAAAWLQDLEQDLAWSVFCALSPEDQASLLEYAEDDLTHLLVPRMSAEDLRDRAIREPFRRYRARRGAIESTLSIHPPRG